MRFTPIQPPRWGAAVAQGIQLAAWLAFNLLAALGFLALAALAIGSFTLDGLMLQLANLATRYVAANAARQAQFNEILIGAFGVSVLIFSLLRSGSALGILFPRQSVARHGNRP
ncbi:MULTISPECIES: hypothetical protein [unclassified Novosphingobium]|mgnify:CR=1 FL=1|uniref:hypothetical protein n=1 Tax=unclassified Novosphingobium TaxID=2644732 RepID=UPI00086BD75C|nr:MULTISPECIES: hypothetical protein [unclassified Novosphingobium]MBN9142430.1 hypothetical protein [Novosphingobium sp.]ODU77534.1 MAG: hypothetical protein ABT10_24520 [Novosphingobium sp. SCN 63-17]OJX88272.1 MAG: hypothetical protein BGP00_07750 [Novosphingobium sp. 63-713]